MINLATAAAGTNDWPGVVVAGICGIVTALVLIFFVGRRR